MAEPTQMLILSIPTSLTIEDPTSPAGKTWNEILDIVRKSEGYKRLYWGRHVEKTENVQLHIGTVTECSKLNLFNSSIPQLVVYTGNHLFSINIYPIPPPPPHTSSNPS
jgi:hypothetical protein